MQSPKQNLKNGGKYAIHEMSLTTAVETVLMHLLHPKRLIEEEGILGVAKIAKNAITKLAARKHVLKMRTTFMKYEQYLQGVCIVVTLKK